MKIHIELEMPGPDTKVPDIMKEPSIEDKIRSMIDMLDTGHSDHVDWETLRRLHQKLANVPNPNKRQKNLLDMLEPIMQKYGYSDAAGFGKDE